MLKHESQKTCLCGSEQTFAACCGKIISATQAAETPEQLMRSRYCAYALKDDRYLLSSWHKSTRPEKLELKDDTTQWQGLKIISASKNEVQFVAYFTQDSLNKEKVYALTELSHFIKNDNWQYWKGDEAKTVQLTKNMPCPCQSGKKYKRCCGKSI